MRRRPPGEGWAHVPWPTPWHRQPLPTLLAHRPCRNLPAGGSGFARGVAVAPVPTDVPVPRCPQEVGGSEEGEGCPQSGSPGWQLQGHHHLGDSGMLGTVTQPGPVGTPPGGAATPPALARTPHPSPRCFTERIFNLI